jgi:two-component system sensor histidine kinase/response regulator
VPLPETQAPAMVSQRSPVPITGRESRPARVLLAEDLTTNQILITAILKRAGHQVDVVETGAAAVEAVQRQDYDLVLMDVQMPIMDGLEATRQIRALEGRVTNIPVVALTASVLEQDVEACRAAGMDDFVAKPIDADALLEAVARWVSPKPADSSAPLREAQSHEAFLVDREKLQRLRNRIGEQLGPLIERCVDDAERTCRSIAAPEVRLEDIIRDAHNLKGTSGMLGLARISQLFGEIQARASDRRLVDHLAAELNEIVTATRTELRSTGLMPSDTDALG